MKPEPRRGPESEEQEGGTEGGSAAGGEGEGGSKTAALVTCLQLSQVPGPVQWILEDHEALQERPLVGKQMYAQTGEGVGFRGEISRLTWGTEEYEGMRKFEAVL